MRVKLPRLLDAGMKEKARMHPIAPVEIELNSEPPSTAKLTISKADAPVKIRDWIELYTREGSAGIYRVTGVEESYDGEQVWITLEHGIIALGDAVIIGEGTFTGSLGDLMSQLLSHQVTKVNGQPLWRVGGTVETRSVRRDYQNPNLLSELIALLGQAGDVMLTFDQSSLPWTVNLVALDENDLCEGRFGRNLRSLTVSVDDNELCTRAVIDGTGETRDADTISQYGVVARVLNISEYATEESADQYVEQYLEAHKEPNVSVEISAVDMSESTGESIDSFRLGRMCRACLPDHGVTVKNRIVSLRLPDVYGDPQDVRVSMGKKQPTFTDLLMQEQEEAATTSSRVSRGYGSAMAGIESNVIRLERSETTLEQIGDTLDDTRLRMSHAGIIIDGEAANVQALATLTVVEDTRMRISKAGINIEGDAGEIKLLATVEETDELSERVSQAQIDIDGANAQIALKASQYELDALGNRVTTAESELIVQADQISTKVSKDGVISSINQTAEEIKIQANKINLSGYVTATAFEAEMALIDNIFAGYSEISALGISGNLYAASANFTDNLRIFDHYSKWQEVKLYKGGTISVSQTTTRNVYDASGNAIGYVTVPVAWSFTASSQGTYHFLGY